MDSIPDSTIMTGSRDDIAGHQQPCFCEVCWWATMDGLISERAALLNAALADRLYADDMEQYMADEVIAAIPVSRRLDVLTHMLTWEHLMPRVMNVDCFLNECDEQSYKALEEMSDVLLAAIRAQGREGIALRELIVNGICDPAKAV